MDRGECQILTYEVVDTGEIGHHIAARTSLPLTAIAGHPDLRKSKGRERVFDAPARDLS